MKAGANKKRKKAAKPQKSAPKPKSKKSARPPGTKAERERERERERALIRRDEMDVHLILRRRLADQARMQRRPGETLADAQARLSRGDIPVLVLDNKDSTMGSRPVSI